MVCFTALLLHGLAMTVATSQINAALPAIQIFDVRPILAMACSISTVLMLCGLAQASPRTAALASKDTYDLARQKTGGVVAKS